MSKFPNVYQFRAKQYFFVVVPVKRIYIYRCSSVSIVVFSLDVGLVPNFEGLQDLHALGNTLEYGANFNHLQGQLCKHSEYIVKCLKTNSAL